MKKLLKLNIKTIIVFILGLLIASSVGIIYALSIASSDVTYDNSTSGSEATTVKNAIDDLYNKIGNSSHIERGRINITFTPGAGWKYVTIQFEKEFESAPTVYYSYSAGGNGGSVYISARTKTSFTLGYNTWFGTSANDTIYWVATEGTY